MKIDIRIYLAGMQMSWNHTVYAVAILRRFLDGIECQFMLWVVSLFFGTATQITIESFIMPLLEILWNRGENIIEIPGKFL